MRLLSRLRGGACAALMFTAIAGNAPLALAQTSFESEFDHFTTGWPLEGAHRNVDCSSCHVGGMFDGTSRLCTDCHSQAGLVQATSVPPGHIASTGECQDCHQENSWAPVWRVDHFQVLGSCSSCHNGSQAAGKPNDHPVTNQDCENCHTSFAWLPASFDHMNVMPGTCNTCHLPDKPAQHLVTQEQCDACHLTTAWLPAFFDHAAVMPGTCSTCHAGDEDPGHFMTSQDCGSCHNSNNWLPVNFSHMSAAYPGDHRRNLDCTDCHGGNSEIVTWPSPAFQPDCAGCHQNDFRSGPHKKYENPDVNYTVSELRDCSGACHIYTDSSLTVIKDSRPGPEHRVNQSDFD